MNAALVRVFVRLVVCQSALERPLFTYTDLSRGGTVCVGVEAGAQQVFGFPWLTPKPFFFIFSQGLVGRWKCVCVCVCTLEHRHRCVGIMIFMSPEQSRRGGSEGSEWEESG